MPHPSDPDNPDEAIGEPGPIPDHLILDPATVSVARNDYDPVSLFRARGQDSGSVTVAASATDAHVEWLTERQRYGHFSGRPLEPDEIAAQYRHQRRVRWSRWGVLVAAAIGAVWLVVWNLTNDPWLSLSSAEPGTCFQDSLASVIVREEIRYEVRTTVEEVDCAAPHQFEMIGMVPMSGFGDTTTMATTADRLCTPLFEEYVGAAPGDAKPWKMASFPPYLMFVAGEQAACLAFQGEHIGATDDAYEPIMVEGAVNGDAGTSAAVSDPHAAVPVLRLQRGHPSVPRALHHPFDQGLVEAARGGAILFDQGMERTVAETELAVGHLWLVAGRPQSLLEPAPTEGGPDPTGGRGQPAGRYRTRGHRLEQDAGGEEIAPRWDGHGVLGGRPPVQLGRASRPRPGPSAEAEVLDVEQPLGGEPVEVVGRRLSGDPDRIGGFVAADGMVRRRHHLVEGTPGGVTEGSDGVDRLRGGRAVDPAAGFGVLRHAGTLEPTGLDNTFHGL